MVGQAAKELQAFTDLLFSGQSTKNCCILQSIVKTSSEVLLRNTYVVIGLYYGNVCNVSYGNWSLINQNLSHMLTTVTRTGCLELSWVLSTEDVLRILQWKVHINFSLKIIVIAR